MTFAVLLLGTLLLISRAHLRTVQPYVKTTLDNIGTLVSQPISTRNIMKFLPTYFVLNRPQPAPNLESSLKALLTELEALPEIPEKQIWVNSVFQVESMLVMSREKIADSYELHGNQQQFDNSLNIPSRVKRDWFGTLLSSWTGLASLDSLLKAADEVENNYDRLSELWVNTENLYSVVNSSSQYIRRNKNSIDNLNTAMTSLTDNVQRIAEIMQEKARM